MRASQFSVNSEQKGDQNIVTFKKPGKAAGIRTLRTTRCKPRKSN
jgi:hypothetical protein